VSSATSARACANCGAALTGEYCGTCGQRDEPHVHSVRHFAAEAFESLSHADSRLWRTLWLLLARPGFLTREFFAGRRARYLPPFRLYLVLSVILVLLTSLGGSDAPAPQEPVAAPAAPATAPEVNTGAKPKDRYALDVDGLNQFCEAFEGPDDGQGNRAARENIRQFCRNVRNNFVELIESVLHSIPRAMFVFLPLLAAIMTLLYWRPRRYYVEHLLFLVHNHAAMFLVYTLVALASFIPVIEAFTPLLFFAALGYLAWYLYRAMRTAYGQGGLLTFAKYVVMFFTYLVTAVTGFLLTVVIIAVWG
jgi:hypothetical protein